MIAIHLERVQQEVSVIHSCLIAGASYLIFTCLDDYRHNIYFEMPISHALAAGNVFVMQLEA